MITQSIRNILFAMTLALPTLPLANQNALANDRRDFVIYNNNELEITKLYVSSGSSKYWGSNLIQSDIVSGSSGKITFGNNSNQCVYDIKAVYTDKTYDVSRANLCQTYGITFYGHGGDYR
ncbi:hypothetical protein AB0759_31465 [Scytonema tolypothrichoides VB-61278_2]|uniref:Uncharacterized protein n=3 Tax=Nostocales TaxID=1161 RepID=A0A0C1QNY8_9CYAN|nr:hypothetical protein [Tolypothrix bouteillei]KAF3889332.1 hypothetical protein DA73_0400030510 [Tolypothrix bouteillei VB521301]